MQTLVASQRRAATGAGFYTGKKKNYISGSGCFDVRCLAAVCISLYLAH